MIMAHYYSPPLIASDDACDSSHNDHHEWASMFYVLEVILDSKGH